MTGNVNSQDSNSPAPRDTIANLTYIPSMNALLNKAFAALSKLPESEQEAIAREMLDRLAGDARWDKLFADPRSRAVLDRLAAEARAEIANGDVIDDDPAGTSAK